MADAAAILYGEPMPAAVATDTVPAVAPRPEPENAPEAAKSPADTLYPDLAGFDPAPFDSVMSALSLDALKKSDTEKADAFEESRKALIGDFQATGTDPAAAADAVGIINAWAYTAPSIEQIEQDRVQNLELLTSEWGEAADTNLTIVRRFVADMDAVSPGTLATLESTGAGNDPKLIRMFLREAKRRGYK